MVKNRLPCVVHKTLFFLALFLPLISTYISAQERLPGELFPPDKIFLLEEHRDWQDTEEIMDRLHLETGDIVADIGAGSGYFTIPLASRVGDKGLVFSEDIQIEMINYISKKVEDLKLKNVRVIFGKAEDPSLLDKIICEPDFGSDSEYFARYGVRSNMWREVQYPASLISSRLPDGIE